MKNILIIFSALIAVSCTSAPKKVSLPEKPVLFEVSKDGKTHYLVGTIHFPVDVNKTYPQLLGKIAESDTFVSEIDTKEMREIPLEEITKELYYYKNGGGTLKTDLSDEAYIAVSLELGNIVPEKVFSQATPVLIADILGEKNEGPTEVASSTADSVIKTELSYQKAEDGRLYDEQLFDHAFSLNKKRVSLESFKDPVLQKCEQLVAVVELEKFAYDRGFSYDLQAAAAAETKKQNCLGSERNQAWAGKIKTILAENKKVFIGVGVGHLLIDSPNLVELLQRDGYKVKNVDIK